MNTSKLAILSLFAAVLLTACNSKKDKATATDEEVAPSITFEFFSEDSIAINELVDRYVACVNAKDFEGAANLLHKVRNDSVIPLTTEERQSYLNAMNHMPQLGCQKKEIKLQTNRDNRVRLALLMNESGSLDEEIATVNFFLNPVKQGSEWFLTAFDTHAEGVGIH